MGEPPDAPATVRTDVLTVAYVPAQTAAQTTIGQSMTAGGVTATRPPSAALTLKGCSSPQEPRPPNGDIGCTKADGLTSPLARQAASTSPRQAARGSE
jgi:hypothetical protein